MSFERICLIVLDSVGIGELPDAASFGDLGTHTLGHIASHVEGFALPNLERLGLGCIEQISNVRCLDKPQAYFGKMAEASVGKDTMTGHWELMGLKVDIPFQTFPRGFPSELIEQFETKTGRKVMGNKPASGTEILDELGNAQMKSGDWIVYTSADSVFQLAAHEEVISLDELYQACEIARKLTLHAPYAVGRVIARPYIGQPGCFRRTSNRHDYALKPTGSTVMNSLQEAGYEVKAIGKISDIYSGEGVTEAIHTKSNDDGITQTIKMMKRSFKGMCFTNLVDFDSLYGHRRDVHGYGQALMSFDQRLPEIMETLGEKDLLIITADHGNDPTHTGTDHTREYVPLLVWNPLLHNVSSLGVRQTFADVGATVAENFGVSVPKWGTSFLKHLV